MTSESINNLMDYTAKRTHDIRCNQAIMGRHIFYEVIHTILFTVIDDRDRENRLLLIPLIINGL